MREIHVNDITGAIKILCISANLNLPADISKALKSAQDNETNSLAKSVLSDLSRNAELAVQKNLPICQDTGMAVVFAQIGQEVHITGGLFEDAVNEGVRCGYSEGYLRKSIVADPLRRVNTGDNTPAVIHVKITGGDKIKLNFCAKGFGSENMSTLKMFDPSAGMKQIINFAVDTVRKAGGNPCPPIIAGIGIGGNFELCAILAKKALCRSIDCPNPDPFYAELETDILRAINETGIGSQGFGGDITALGVNIETAPTHIAGLPVAINIGCHVTRHQSVIL